MGPGGPSRTPASSGTSLGGGRGRHSPRAEQAGGQRLFVARPLGGPANGATPRAAPLLAAASPQKGRQRCVAAQRLAAAGDEVKTPQVARRDSWGGPVSQPLLRHDAAFRADRLAQRAREETSVHAALRCVKASTAAPPLWPAPSPTREAGSVGSPCPSTIIINASKNNCLLCEGQQLAVDTAFVSPLPGQGQPVRGGGGVAGAALALARRREERPTGAQMPVGSACSGGWWAVE